MAETKRSVAMNTIWRWAGVLDDVWGRLKMLFVVFSIASAVLLSSWYFLLRSAGVVGIIALLVGIASAVGAAALALAAMRALKAEASRSAGITPEELQEALKAHAAKTKREEADRAELVDTLVKLANRGKSDLADQLQALLDDGVRVHESYSFIPLGFNSTGNADIREWTQRVEAALAPRPRDLALFRLSPSTFATAINPLGAERMALDQKLSNLARIIKKVRSGQ